MSIVSITIAAKNEEKNIGKSLGSALNQSYSPIEIFLIDDTSSDRTSEVAREVYDEFIEKSKSVLPPPNPLLLKEGEIGNGSTLLREDVNFTVIKNTKNLGFGGSHNVGIRKAKGDFVLCLNADCELDENYVKYAVEVFNRNKAIGAVQGKLLNRKTGKLDTTGLCIFKNRRVINRGQGEDDTGQYEKLEEIWGVDGAAPVYRRKMLEDVKIPRYPAYEYFDQDFFAYKEDIDLSWRMRLAGWKCIYQPKVIAYHDRSAGEGTKRNALEIIRERRKIGEFAKLHSFPNQRLMQIKNETPGLFFKHAPGILLKEAMAWPYVLLFEKYGWKSAMEFFKLLPKTIRKRKYVMAKKRISDEEMERWFL